MNNDCVEVDALILEIADYTNDYSEMAAEKLEEVLDQLGSLSLSTRPGPRQLATQQRTLAVTTNYQKDSGADISSGNMAMRMRGRERGCAESAYSSSFHACISRSSLPFHRCSESGSGATVGVSSW